MLSKESDQVTVFLRALGDSAREAFVNYAEHTYSVYEIWLYAGVLGYSGSFVELEKWVSENHKKLNRRDLLLREICKLEEDIDAIRQQSICNMVKPESAASRIAQLSKEMRGHVVEVERMSKPVDRRGLVLAGADRVMRELNTIFENNAEIKDALDEAFESIWTRLIAEV